MAKKKEEATEPTQQKAKPPPTFNDLMGAIQSVDEMAHMMRMKTLLFGRSGAGKSRAGALAAPGKRVLIGLTEQQARPTIEEMNPVAQVFSIHTAGDAAAFAKLVSNPEIAEHFDAVVLDSLTDVMEKMRDHYTAKQGGKAAGSDKTSQETWGIIIDNTKKFVRKLRDAPVHVLCLALEEETIIDQVRIKRPMVYGKKLGSELPQFFNVVGYIHKQTRGDEDRHEVLFGGDESYSTKGMSCLRRVEPPEPQYWIHKRFGGELPDDVRERVESWEALGES